MLEINFRICLKKPNLKKLQNEESNTEKNMSEEDKIHGRILKKINPTIR